MHQTFTLQTRWQTKRDGVRAEKAEQDAFKRPNQDGQACASPRAAYSQHGKRIQFGRSKQPGGDAAEGPGDSVAA